MGEIIIRVIAMLLVFLCVLEIGWGVKQYRAPQPFSTNLHKLADHSDGRSF
jgi:hypothetical protein